MMGVIDGIELDSAQIIGFCVFACLGLGFLSFVVSWLIETLKAVFFS